MRRAPILVLVASPGNGHQRSELAGPPPNYNNCGELPIESCTVAPAGDTSAPWAGGRVTQESPSDLVVVQKLRALIAEKANQARSGSPERYRLQEMLDLTDDALLDSIYSQIEPNPTRVGCPPQETLRELATRTRRLSDPWWDHVMTCSACGVDVRQMGLQRPVPLARSHVQAYLWAPVTVLLLAVGLGGWWLKSSGAVTLVTGDLRQYALTRSDQPVPTAYALDLPPRRVRLTLVLPNGSETGPYALEVRDTDGRVRATAKGTASLQEFVTRLETDVDLSSVPRGLARLAVRRDSEDWQLFPVRVQ